MAERLRIAVLGWARLDLQAWEGSGYNLVASELSAEIAARGHEVVYLRSGMDFEARPGFRFRLRGCWRGVTCYDAVNSPNLAPAASNFRNMEREIASPAHSAAVIGWMHDAFGALPDVAHVHSLEGFGLDLIGALEDAGVRVVVTPHNYWFACPQVDLLHREREICFDYDGGRRCEGCLPSGDAGKIRRDRLRHQVTSRVVGEKFAGTLRQGIWMFRDRNAPDGPRPWDPGDADWSGGAPTFDCQGDPRDEPGEAPLDANERFLARGEGEDVHLRVLDGSVYGRRRAAGVAALSRASLVTPPSRFMGDVYERMGVPGEKVRVTRLGLPHLDAIRAAAQGSAFADAEPWRPGADRPLRLLFLGTTRPNKGLEVLTRAIESLDEETRRVCRFTIRASGDIGPLKRRLSHLPEVAMGVGYDVTDLPGMAADYDVGVLPHIWFENSPIVMLEHLNAGRYVIASRLGGTVDWIEDGVNGSLFRGGDHEALARVIGELVRGERELPRAVESGLLSSSGRFADETETAYGSVVSAASC